MVLVEGLGWGVLGPHRGVRITHRVHAEHRLGPRAAGRLYDHLHSYTWAFWMCAAAFVLAAVSVALTPTAGGAMAREP
jgi:hypothetical protein